MFNYVIRKATKDGEIRERTTYYPYVIKTYLTNFNNRLKLTSNHRQIKN